LVVSPVVVLNIVLVMCIRAQSRCEKEKHFHKISLFEKIVAKV
jgi:hypothetical protein